MPVDVRAFRAARQRAAAPAEQDPRPRPTPGRRRRTGASSCPAGRRLGARVREELDRACVDLLDRVAERAEHGDLDAGCCAAASGSAVRGGRLPQADELQGTSGDRAGAVTTYHACVSVLERELGVEPAPETRGRVDALLAGRATRRAHPEPARAGRPGPRRTAGCCAAGGVGGSARPGPVRAGPRRGRRRQDPAGRRAGREVRASRRRGRRRPLLRHLRPPGAGPGRGLAAQPGRAGGRRGADAVWRAEVRAAGPRGRRRPSRRGGERAMVDAWQRHRFFEGLARAVLGVGPADAAQAGQPAMVRQGDAGLAGVPARARRGPRRC